MSLKQQLQSMSIMEVRKKILEMLMTICFTLKDLLNLIFLLRIQLVTRT